MTLFAAKCASCHSVAAAKSLGGANFAKIRSGIVGNKGGMGSLSALTDTELQDIAAYVAQ
jgi:mono/diheme cytochrome c family protein